MLQTNQHYDVAIVGGGLAGLTLSIQCADAGYKTILFEKEQYPFHKVCGEYISYESWDFLQDLGVDLDAMNVSHTTGCPRSIARTLLTFGIGVSDP